MNHALQAWNATEARQLKKELVQRERLHKKEMRKLNAKLDRLVNAVACRQLGLRRGTTVRLVDPQKESVAAQLGMCNQIFVVTDVEVSETNVAALLRLAMGKKAIPNFVVSLRSESRQIFYIYGNQTTLARDLRREKPARCEP